MKFSIFYEYRNGEDSFSGQFDFEAEREPTTQDEAVIDAALKDSVKFQKYGMGGLSITSISSIL